MKWEPRPHQEQALPRIRKRLDRFGAAHVWMDMGLGKTAVVATILAELLDDLRATRVLVVSTKRIIERVWPVELRKWDHLKHVPFRSCAGKRDTHRHAMFTEPYYGIELMTFGMLSHSMSMLKKKRLPWDVIVYDESSKMKSPSTARFKAMRPRVTDIEMTICMTGSPAPQGLLNVWAPMFLADKGERLGTTYTDYRNRFFYTHPGQPWKWVPQPWGVDEIHKRCDNIVVAMQAKDWLEMPPLTVNDVHVPWPSDRLQRTYRELEKDMFLQLEHGTVEAANGGVLTNKCRQFVNGALYLDGRHDRWQELHTAKLDALDDIVEELEGKPLIVAYQFQFDLAHLKKKYPKAVTLDDVTDDDWNTGKYPMLLIHPASAAHGLNLQGGSDTLAFFGCGYSADLYEQTVARIAGGLRRGRHTMVHRIVMDESIDLDVLDCIEHNCSVQDSLMKRMKLREAA